MINDQRPPADYNSFAAASTSASFGENSFDNDNSLHPILDLLAAVGIWAASVLLLGILPAVALLLYIGVYKGFDFNASEMTKDPLAIVINLIAIFPVHLLTLWLTWMIVTRNGKQSFWKTIGWKWNGYGFIACLLTTVALYAMAVGIISATGEQENELTRLLQSSRTAVYLTAIMATFTAPLVEEVVYRGVMFPGFKRFFDWFVGILTDTFSALSGLKTNANLQKVVSNIAAIAVVTFLFALVHVPQYLPSYGTILVITILSLVLTVIRAYTQSLLPCFVIHTLFNGFQAILLILEPYFPKSEAPVVEPSPALIWLLANLW